MTTIPQQQRAVQLIDKDKLVLNTQKPVDKPGPYQLLCRVEAVGLCFSDLKLLKQFDDHVRKSELVKGISPEVLKEVPSYVPGKKPTVPGHEAVVEVLQVGDKVKDYRPGERYLVQADYRYLRTATSNGAFGYNIEGALQEYVIMDQRVFTDPQSEAMMIKVADTLSASAAGLVEPWGCVENAYVSSERNTLKKEGRLLVAVEGSVDTHSLEAFLRQSGRSAEAPTTRVDDAGKVGALAEQGFDDIIYLGANPATIEVLFKKLALNGLMIIALGGQKLSRAVVCPVGRVHYAGIRIVGTVGNDPAEALKIIPPTGEMRPGDIVNVVGAAGPMGVMHVIRNICQGIPKVTVLAGDLDDTRLRRMDRFAAPLAKKNGINYRSYNPATQPPTEPISYVVLMVPSGKLLAAAIESAGEKAIVNIFAGIPVTVDQELNLQRYIEKRLFMMGTSGSTMDDMRKVYQKVASGQLDTNLSVAAISGLDGAIDGIRATEAQAIAGKILVYPSCHGLKLTKLEDLGKDLPDVASCLDNGIWTTKAEKQLLQRFKTN